MRRSFFSLLVAVWAIGFAGVAQAADIRRSEHPLYGFVLEGTIVPGDYDKLRKLIEEDCPAKYYNSACASDIYLASPGGSVTEAMKIGRLVRSLRWGTQAPEDVPADLRQKMINALKLEDPKSNYLCTSACFFIFVAGIERSITADKVFLGIHRPFMSDADLRAVNANQAMASATQARSVVNAYLKEMSVPAKYADLMFSIPKDQVRWIAEADFKADFMGLVSELRDWMNARCDKRTDTDRRLQELLEEKFERGQLTPADKEMRTQLFKKFDEPQINCEFSVKAKMREDAWKAFQRL
jgi:hypothetical protein